MQTIGDRETEHPPPRPFVPNPEVTQRHATSRFSHVPRRVWIAAVVVVVVVLAAVIAVQGFGIRRLDRDLTASRRSDTAARETLIGTRARLDHDVDVLLDQLDSTTAAYNSRTAQAGRLYRSLQDTIHQLKTTRGTLDQTQSNLNTQVDKLKSTRTCLQGVQLALEQVAVSDFIGATNDVKGVAAACDAALDRSDAAIGHAVYDGSAADPFMTHVGNTYYAYTTNSVGGAIQLLSGPSPGQLDLQGPALAKPAPWASAGDTWAPSVLQRGNSWVMYYSAEVKGSNEDCISRATATSPAGPFVDDTFVPILCQFDLGGSIDPSPTVGIDGTPWLVWRSIGNAQNPPQIWSEPLTPDGLFMSGWPPAVLLTAQSGGWEDGLIEAPAMTERGNRWLLFYSGNQWDTVDYAIGAASCTGPMGPCHRLGNGPVFEPGPPLVGAGGGELFTGPDGKAWMAFHAWVDGQVGYPNPRRLYVARVDLDTPTPIIQQVIDT